MFPFLFRLLRNQSPHGQYAPVHLLYSPAYILPHLQSDRLMRWFWDYFAFLQDKGRLPSSHIVQVPFPENCGIFPLVLFVIYLPCPILLSSPISIQKAPEYSPKKKEPSMDSFHLKGIKTLPQLTRCLIKWHCSWNTWDMQGTGISDSHIHRS